MDTIARIVREDMAHEPLGVRLLAEAWVEAFRDPSPRSLAATPAGAALVGVVTAAERWREGDPWQDWQGLDDALAIARELLR